MTASMYDLSLDMAKQFSNIETIVVLGIFAVLMIVLGSLLLPAFAVLSIAMSISWSFALTTLIFGSWLGKPILFIIPLILFIMLMGIGMDYNAIHPDQDQGGGPQGKGDEGGRGGRCRLDRRDNLRPGTDNGRGLRVDDAVQ